MPTYIKGYYEDLFCRYYVHHALGNALVNFSVSSKTVKGHYDGLGKKEDQDARSNLTERKMGGHERV